MYTNAKHQSNLATETQEYTHKKYSNQKRSRKENQDLLNNNSNKILKPRQPKALFRPWSDNQTTEMVNEIITNKKDISANQTQPKIDLTPAPLHLTPYQMAIQQQQHQNSFALQQAMYQQQLFMTHIWAQQRQQHHQHLMMYHQQIRQQLFGFGQKQGHQ